MKAMLLSAVAMALLVSAQSSGAQGAARGQGRKGDAPPAQVKSSGPAVDIEIRLIRDYFSSSRAKPKPLPPGIAKNLARGKPLPPGIAKKQLPYDLVQRLPARSGTRWILAGDVVVLVDLSDVVVDVFRAIL